MHLIDTYAWEASSPLVLDSTLIWIILTVKQSNNTSRNKIWPEVKAARIKLYADYAWLNLRTLLSRPVKCRKEKKTSWNSAATSDKDGDIVALKVFEHQTAKKHNTEWIKLLKLLFIYCQPSFAWMQHHSFGVVQGARRKSPLPFQT